MLLNNSNNLLYEYNCCIKILAVKKNSSQVFYCWSKCWEKPEMHSYQIWIFYVLPFSRYCSLKLKIFLLLQCSPVLWQKDNFRNVGLNLLEKQLIYNSNPLLCFDNNTAENTWEI